MSKRDQIQINDNIKNFLTKNFWKRIVHKIDGLKDEIFDELISQFFLIQENQTKRKKPK